MSVSAKKMYSRACIPPGMDMALQGLAREVLREQPRDLYRFAATHFERLLKIRDLAGKNCFRLELSCQFTQTVFHSFQPEIGKVNRAFIEFKQHRDQRLRRHRHRVSLLTEAEFSKDTVFKPKHTLNTTD